MKKVLSMTLVVVMQVMFVFGGSSITENGISNVSADEVTTENTTTQNETTAEEVTKKTQKEGTRSTIESGECGDNLTWTYNKETKRLEISGTGNMYDYGNGNRPMWENFHDIESIIINEGVTSTGESSFSRTEYQYMYLPESLVSVKGIERNSYSWRIVSVKEGSVADEYCKNHPTINYTYLRSTDTLPQDCVGLTKIRQKDNTVTFTWGEPLKGQIYRVYIDGYYYGDYSNSAIVDMVVLSGGKHTIKVSSIVVGNRSSLISDGKTFEVIIEEKEDNAQSNNKFNNPRVNQGGTTWDTVYFGHYPQTLNGEGEYLNEPIKWRVLSTKGEKILLLSDKVIEECEFNKEGMISNLHWGVSSLRRWMNGTFLDTSNDNSFYDKAFTNQEKNIIKTTTLENYDIYKHWTEDKLFILKYNDAHNQDYGFKLDDTSSIQSSLMAKITDYAKRNTGVGQDIEDGYARWWLNGVSWGNNSEEMVFLRPVGVVQVTSGGNIYSTPGDLAHGLSGVRPAMWVDSSSPLIKKAGTISSDGTEVEETTNTQNSTNANENTKTESDKDKYITVISYGGISKKVKTPKIKKAVKKKSSKKVRVRLAKNKSVKGYKVAVYKTKKQAKKNKKALLVKYKKKAKFAIKSKRFKNRKKLFIKVKAYGIINNKKVFSKWSKVKSVKTK